MLLQPRDRALLRFIYEQQVVTTEHIEKHFFPGTAERTARRRLLALEEAALIRRDTTVILEGRRLVRLTRRSTALVAADYPVKVPQRVRLDLVTVPHDAAVTSVRIRLAQLWQGRWIPEGLLKGSGLTQIPDGLWIFPNGNRVAIEVERSQKGGVKFHRLQERWRDSGVRLVLYVGVGQEMMHVLREYLETGPSDLAFGLVSFDALMAGTPPVWTCVGELDLLSKEEF